MTSRRPRARGASRRVDGPASTYARATIRSSRARSRLFSALATADFSAFSSTRAALCGMKRSRAWASATGLPRICSATRRTLVGEMRMYLAIAFVSMNRRAPLLAAVHLLADGDGHVLTAVVDGDGVPDELRQNGRAPRPGADHAALPRAIQLAHLHQQVRIHERALLSRPSHLYQSPQSATLSGPPQPPRPSPGRQLRAGPFHAPPTRAAPP